MQITKFTINNPKLSMIATFVWHLTSETAISDRRPLPVISTDLIINLSAPFTYRFIEGQDEQAPSSIKRILQTKFRKIIAMKDQNDQVSEHMNDIFYEGFSENEIVEFEKYLERILTNLTWREQ